MATVRLMAPKFVAPYRLSGKQGKNDAADAAAICEAVQRPHMRFVPIKTVEQQGQLCIHRVRQGFIEQRTATINRIRGLLSEFGIVLPLNPPPSDGAMAPWKICQGGPTPSLEICSTVSHLDKHVEQYDQHIEQIAKGTQGTSNSCAPGCGTHHGHRHAQP